MISFTWQNQLALKIYNKNKIGKEYIITRSIARRTENPRCQGVAGGWPCAMAAGSFGSDFLDFWLLFIKKK